MKVAIIGGYGRMGRWLARTLKEDGHEVVISGRDEIKLAQAADEMGVTRAESAPEAVKGARIVLLATSIDSLDAVAAEVAPHLTEEQLVVDIASVKTGPVASLKRHIRTARVLGAHPLFGPGAPGFRGQNVVLTPTDEAENQSAASVKDFLEARGARVSLMSPEVHDRMMATILALSHFIALVTADTLTESGDIAAMEAVSGTTFRALLAVARAVLTEDPDFYASLQTALPGAVDAEALFISRAETWAETVKQGDKEGFAHAMAELSGKFRQIDPELEKAYHQMYRPDGS